MCAFDRSDIRKYKDMSQYVFVVSAFACHFRLTGMKTSADLRSFSEKCMRYIAWRKVRIIYRFQRFFSAFWGWVRGRRVTITFVMLDLVFVCKKQNELLRKRGTGQKTRKKRLKINVMSRIVLSKW